MNPEHYLSKQKATPGSIYLQDDVGRELEKLVRMGHLEKINDSHDDRFVFRVVITVESEKSVKLALDPQKLNDSFNKMEPQMPNMEEPVNHD